MAHRLNRALLLCALLLVPLFSVPGGARAEELGGCLAGQIPITTETRATATEAGVPPSSACWNPSDPNVGLAAGTAKVYLKSILCSPDGDNYGGEGPDGTIEKLD